MERKITKYSCFGYKNVKGVAICTVLNNAECKNCNFYRTILDYQKNVAPLKHRKKV